MLTSSDNVLATKQDIVDITTTLSDKIDGVDSGLKQLIANVVDEVNENQAIIETEKVTFSVTI